MREVKTKPKIFEYPFEVVTAVSQDFITCFFFQNLIDLNLINLNPRSKTTEEKACVRGRDRICELVASANVFLYYILFFSHISPHIRWILPGG